MDNTYDLGDTVLIEGEFRNEDGQLLDPTSAVLTVKKADGTSDVFRYPTPAAGEGEIQHPSLGLLRVPYVADVAGATWRRWDSSGAVAGVEEEYFTIRSSHVL